METLVVFALAMWGIIETYNHLRLRKEITNRCYSHLSASPSGPVRDAQRALINQMSELERLVWLEQAARAEGMIGAGGFRNA